ncbi:unnamed protein product [Schistosoma turkestanicum]|nr:unnamed protein product [Schistosoma turkestanicum]
MKSTFNLNDYLNTFTSVWKLLQENLVNKLNEFLTAEKQQQIDESLKIISYAISIIGYIMITIIMILITLVLVYCIVYTVDAYDRKLFMHQTNLKYNSYKLFTLQIQGKFHEKLFALKLNRSLYLPHHILLLHKTQLKYITISVTLISILLSFILSTLCILLPLIILIDTEVCRYLTSDSGVRLTDFTIDLFIQYQWSNGIFTRNSSIISQDLWNYINLPAPRYVYSTIRDQCQRTMFNNVEDSNHSMMNKTHRNYNLLKLLNYHQIIDFNKILNSSEIQQKIKDAETSSVNEIINMNLASFIPSDLDSLTLIARKLSIYLDGKNYTPTIQEINHFKSFKVQLLNYINELITFTQFTRNNFTNFIDIIEQLNNSLIIYDQLIVKLNPLIDSFKKFESNKNLTQRLDQILNGLNQFKNISSDPKKLEQPIRPIFDSSIKSLLNQTNQLLNIEFEQLFANILPCDNLNKILLAVLNLFCNRKQSIILCLGSFILIICITYFLLIVTLIIFILYSRQHIQLSMLTRWENIPLYDSVKLCYALLEYHQSIK